MYYLLINKDNIIVDVLSEVRYIKLQSQPAVTVGCEKKEATGVIGSDCNTHYPLYTADAYNKNAVRIVESETIPSDYKPDMFIYNFVTQEIEQRFSLRELQDLKQNENKRLFSAFLKEHPVFWTDGKLYGCTEEDQSEINLNITQYQIDINAGVENPILEWHAQQEENVAWTLEDLSALYHKIATFVYPYYHKMQQQKTAIYNTANAKDLDNITLSFEL